MSDTRRIAYGFNRRPSDFKNAYVDDIWIDTDATERQERRRMVAIALRGGDTLVVVRVSDLGAGRGLQNLRSVLEKRGVTIETFDPPEEKRPVGRPAKGGLTEVEWDRFETLWRDPATAGGYLIGQACAAMGEDKNEKKARERVRQRLLRRFGPRIG